MFWVFPEERPKSISYFSQLPPGEGRGEPDDKAASYSPGSRWPEKLSLQESAGWDLRKGAAMPEGSPEECQPQEEHLRNVAEMAKSRPMNFN